MPEKELPYRKKIFDFLTEKFSDFRLNEQDFYNKIDSDDGYSDKVFTVISDKFSDFTKGKDDFIGDLKKKKDITDPLVQYGVGQSFGLDGSKDVLQSQFKEAGVLSPLESTTEGGITGEVKTKKQTTQIDLANMLDKSQAFKSIQPVKVAVAKKIEETPDLLPQLYESLKSGSANLGAIISRTPSMLYDIAAYPQNKIAQLIGNKELEATSGEFGKMVGLPENQIAQHYEAIVKEHEAQIQATYDKGITEYFKSSEYGKGFSLLANRIVESLPITAGIALSGGAGATMGEITAAGGLAFGAQKKHELDAENPNMSEADKTALALANGLAEGFFESYSLGKIGSAVREVLAKEGKEAATEFAKKSFRQVYNEAFKKYLPLTAPVLEGITEAETQFVQNALDKYSGNKPDMDLSENVSDAFLIGIGSGATIASPATVVQAIRGVKGKIKAAEAEKVKAEFEADLQNPNIASEAKQIISEQIKEKTAEINDEVIKDNESFDRLTDEGKAKVESLNVLAEQLNASIKNPEISEPTKDLFKKRLTETETEIEAILKLNKRNEKEQQEQTATDDVIPTRGGTDGKQPSGEGITPTPPDGVSPNIEEIQKEVINQEREFLEKEIKFEENYLTEAESKRSKLRKFGDKLSGVKRDSYLQKIKSSLSKLSENPRLYFENKLKSAKEWAAKNPDDANPDYISYLEEILQQKPKFTYLNPETGEKASKEEYDVITGTPTEIGGYKVTGEAESVGGERVFTVIDENGNERFLTADGKELQVAKQKLTERDITKAADEANIEWDNDTDFMDKSEELTGKRELSKMTPKELGVMMEYVKSQVKDKVVGSGVVDNPALKDVEVVKNEFTGSDVFYHGTTKSFDKFEKVTKAGQDKEATEQPIFLSEDKSFAEANAVGKDAKTIEVKVKGGKFFDFRKDVFNKDGNLTPLGEKIRDAVDNGEINLEGTRFSDYDGDKVLNNKLSTGDYDFIERKAFVDWLKKEGYDGAFLKEHPSEKATNLAVWNTDKLEINKPKSESLLSKEQPQAGKSVVDNTQQTGEPKASEIEQIQIDGMKAMLANPKILPSQRKYLEESIEQLENQKAEREGLRASDKKTLTTILQKVFGLNKQKSQMTATIFDAVAKSLKANFGIDLYEQMAYANTTEEDIKGIEHLKQESTVKDKLLAIFKKFGINQAGFSESTEWNLGKSIDAELKKQGLDLAYEAQRYGQGGSYGNWHIVRKGRGTHVNANYQGFLRQKSQGAYQYIDALNKIIYAITDPNVSTPIHEIAHAYFDFLIDAAIGGNEQAIKDVQSALDFAGLPKDTNISKLKTNKKMRKKVHELFARGFEKYLKTGKAPYPLLQKVFDNFKKWLTAIYESVKGLDDIKINKNMRDVYARMLTPITKEEQKQNKRAEEYGFKNKHHALNSVIKELGLPKETNFEDLTDEQLQQTKGIKDSREQSAEDQEKFFQSLGIDTNRGKDTITNPEVDIIKNQFKSWGRGFIEAMRVSKRIEKGEKDIDIFIKSVVRAAIKRLTDTKGLNPRQVDTLTKELLRVNSPKRMYEFLYFMDKVLSDIKYAENIEKVKKLQKTLNKKGFPSAVYEKIVDFLSINPTFLKTEQIEKYRESLEALSKKVVNVKPMNEIFDEIMDTQMDSVGISLENRLARENKETKNKYKDDLAGYQEYLYDKAFEEAKNTIESARNAFEDRENPTVEEYLYFKNRVALAYRQIRKLQLADSNNYLKYQKAIDALIKETQSLADEFKKIEKTLKDALIKEIANKKIDTKDAADDEVKTIENAKRLTVEDLNRLTVEDLDLLNNLLENAEDGIIDLGLLLEVVSKAQAESWAQKLARVLKEVPKLSAVKLYKKIAARDWAALSTALDLPRRLLRDGINSTLNTSLAKKFTNIMHNQFVSNERLIEKFKDVGKRLGKLGKRIENANKIGLIFSYLDTKYGGNIDWLYYILNPDAIDKLDDKYLTANLKNLVPYAIRTEGWMKEFNKDPQRQVKAYFQNQMDYMFPLNFKGNKKKQMMAKIHQELASLYGDGVMVDKDKILAARENRDADLMTKDMWAFFDKVQEVIDVDMVDKIKSIASMKGKRISLIVNYMSRMRIGGLKSALDLSAPYKRDFRTSSPTTKEREEDGISGRETNIEILIRHIITNTNREHSTLFESPYIRKLLQALQEQRVPTTLLDAIEAKIHDSLERQYLPTKVNKFLFAIKRAFTMRILGKSQRIAQEMLSAIGAIWRTGRPFKVAKSIATNIGKKEGYIALLEFTNSSLINEIPTQKFSESGEGATQERSDFDKLNDKLAIYTVGIGELIIKKGVFMSSFEREFLLATGIPFDMSKFKSDENYRNEHYAAIQESGDFAEALTKNMIGSTYTSEGRGRVKLGLGLSIDVKNPWSTIFTFLSGYNARAGERFLDAIKGKYGWRGIHVALGTISEQWIYLNSRIALLALGNYLRIMAKIALDDDDDDDEKQKKAALAELEKEWQRIRSPEFIISSLSSGVLSSFFGAYGAVFGKISSFVLASTIYTIQGHGMDAIEEQADSGDVGGIVYLNNENKKAMSKLFRDHFQTTPIDFNDLSKQKASESLSKIIQIPEIEAISSTITKPIFGEEGFVEAYKRWSLSAGAKEALAGLTKTPTKEEMEGYNAAISETTKTELGLIGLSLLLETANIATIIFAKNGIPAMEDLKKAILSNVEPFNKKMLKNLKATGKLKDILRNPETDRPLSKTRIKYLEGIKEKYKIK